RLPSPPDPALRAQRRGHPLRGLERGEGAPRLVARGFADELAGARVPETLELVSQDEERVGRAGEPAPRGGGDPRPVDVELPPELVEAEPVPPRRWVHHLDEGSDATPGHREVVRSRREADDRDARERR